MPKKSAFIAGSTFSYRKRLMPGNCCSCHKSLQGDNYVHEKGYNTVRRTTFCLNYCMECVPQNFLKALFPEEDELDG